MLLLKFSTKKEDPLHGGPPFRFIITEDEFPLIFRPHPLRAAYLPDHHRTTGPSILPHPAEYPVKAQSWLFQRPDFPSRFPGHNKADVR